GEAAQGVVERPAGPESRMGGDAMSVQITYSDEEYDALQAVLLIADDASKEYARTDGKTLYLMERLGFVLGQLAELGGLPDEPCHGHDNGCGCPRHAAGLWP